MTFDAVMFLTEAGRFITFNGTCKVNLIFNSRFKKKLYHSDIFFFQNRQRFTKFRSTEYNCIVG